MSSLGVTPPISTALPTQLELRRNDELEAFLRCNNICESEEGNRRRDEILQSLSEPFREWVVDVGRKRGVADEECADGAGSRLFVFGSQRLGVHTPNSDIDILCCAPQFVTRYDFFLTFFEKLQDIQDVSNLLPLPDAYTPVIKFSKGDYAIDLVFVSLAMAKIPEDIDILDNNNLRNLDEASIRSLNGVRVTEKILHLVPNQNCFRMSLRAIKFWATRRGIYANVLGFLGGINFAILVAFVCQRFPQACPSTIVHNFFKIYSRWQWPNPVVLSGVENADNVDLPAMIKQLSWNPRLNPNDSYHLMPIITPAFPSMNSAFNVGVPQFRMIQLEMQRGLFLHQTLENMPSVSPIGTSVSANTESVSANASNCNYSEKSKKSILWNAFYAPAAADFFRMFPRYIQIDVTATCAEEHLVWFGWCESRLRQLYVSIEQSQHVFSHPSANCYHRRMKLQSSGTDADQGYVSTFFIGLSFPEGTRSVNLTETVSAFKNRVCSWVGKTSGMDMKLRPIQGNDLPEFVFLEESRPSNTKGCTPRKGSYESDGPCLGASDGSQDNASIHISEQESEKTNLHATNSTPTLAMLQLNSSSKSESDPHSGLDKKSHTDKSHSIEKQLFFDSAVAERSSQDSRTHCSDAKGPPQANHIDTSSFASHSHAAPPPLSPNKSSRLGTSQDKPTPHANNSNSSMEHLESSFAARNDACNRQDTKASESGSTAHFSSPLKRVRQN